MNVCTKLLVFMSLPNCVNALKRVNYCIATRRWINNDLCFVPEQDFPLERTEVKLTCVKLT